MHRSIFIIGGLDGDPDVGEVVSALTARGAEHVTWEWIVAPSTAAFRPEQKAWRRLLHRIGEYRKQLKDRAAQATRPREDRRVATGTGLAAVVTAQPQTEVVVLKLHLLHGESSGQLFRVWPDPVLVPKTVRTADGLVEWIYSCEAGLIPQAEWMLNLEETALVCLLAKLVKNKSWNKDTQGHQWTKEADLLGQSPVDRSDLPGVRPAAKAILYKLEGKLFLTKGNDQGKTPREWCINICVLPAVKRAIIEHSLRPLLEAEGLGPAISAICQETDRSIRVDQDVVSERVRQSCRT